MELVLQQELSTPYMNPSNYGKRAISSHYPQFQCHAVQQYLREYYIFAGNGIQYIFIYIELLLTYNVSSWRSSVLEVGSRKTGSECQYGKDW
jgi:hypothetical protein